MLQPLGEDLKHLKRVRYLRFPFFFLRKTEMLGVFSKTRGCVFEGACFFP